MASKADQARAILKTRSPEPPESLESDFLSVGLTLGNLAISGHPDRGLQKGRIYRICGRSQTAKTFLARTILAEAARSSYFSDYELTYDDVERGALMST